MKPTKRRVRAAAKRYLQSQWRRLPREARRFLRRFRCRHTHTFAFALDGARREYGNPHGSRTSKDHGLVLRGCYQCGRVYVEDYRA